MNLALFPLSISLTTHQNNTQQKTSIPFCCCVFGLFIPDSVGEKFQDHIPQIM